MFRVPARRLAALSLCLFVAFGCDSQGHDHDHDHDHEHGDHDDHDDHDHDGDGHADHDAEDHDGHDHADHDDEDHDGHDHDGEDHDGHDDKDGDTAMAPATDNSFYAMTTESLSGDALDLSDFHGKVTLVVNVASECGLTPQYKGLQAMHEELSGEGFSVLAFPSNDFGGQEPGSPEQIQEFCSANYGVSFPMAHKVQTKDGAGQSPIYAHLKKQTGELPSWNFGKYLISRDGSTIQYFDPRTTPDDSALRTAIKTELGKTL